MGNNYLSGTIPDLSTLSGIQRLNMGGNWLEGSVPDLQNLEKIEFLDLAGNPRMEV
jgi:hypothetical protein